MNENKIENQENHELAVVPIFRGNDLYQAMFPEIKPLFEKGESVGPSKAKKVLDAIIENRGKAVILDITCRQPLTRLKLEDFPSEFEQKDLPFNEGKVDKEAFKLFLKAKFDIDYSHYDVIDERISEKFKHASSQELAKNLFEIAKAKNDNIKKVYILTESISDHAGELQFEPDLLLKILGESAQKEFNIEPQMISTLKSNEIHEGDLVVVDRHNSAVSTEKINEIYPRQVSLLPIGTELFNNQQFLGNEMPNEDLAQMLRKDFEKTS